MTALVGTDGDTVCVLLDGGAYNIIDATIVTEMNNLGTLRLDQSPHDIDRRIMAIEQRSSGNKTQWRDASLARRA